MVPKRKFYHDMPNLYGFQKKLKYFFTFCIHQRSIIYRIQTMQSTNQFRRRITRDRSSKALYTIIEFFDPEESRNLGTRRYRIPAHQRFPSWSEEKKQKLIDTILQDYPLGSIIVTSHVEISVGGSLQQYFNIQDGQTRLTVLHEFSNNKFSTKDGRYYRDLSEEERARFNNYQISWELIEKVDATTDREFDEIIADMFERLNSGKPLTDNDKFHARLSTPVMRLVESLRTSPEFGILLKKYCWSEIGGGKKFTGLKEMAAVIMSVILRDAHFITTSYALNGERMVRTDIKPEDVEQVSRFLRWYFSIIECAIPNVSKPTRGMFNKIPSTLGMMLFDWIQHPGATHDAMWVNFIKANYEHKDFIKTLFATLNDGDRRCATISAFNAKFTAVVTAFTPSQSFDHVIAQITGVVAYSGANNGSDTETDEEN